MRQVLVETVGEAGLLRIMKLVEDRQPGFAAVLLPNEAAFLPSGGSSSGGSGGSGGSGSHSSSALANSFQDSTKRLHMR